MRAPSIATFYSPQQVCTELIAEHSYSKSPSKPTLVMDSLQQSVAGRFLESHSFPAFNRSDFLIAHQAEYVNAFFSGQQPECCSNGIPWSQQLANSVCYTNASLYHAQLHAFLNPAQVSFSPTSGFHHARPHSGAAFCTFSGQVISALKLYREYQISGAWLDLDAHFGNSIEDSRNHIKDLDLAIPRDCNINPKGKNSDYLQDLKLQLDNLERHLLDGKIHWIAFAHGADSHEADDIPTGQLSTEEWFAASSMVYGWIREMDQKLGRPVPLTIALFGGYRDDDYQSVIDLHVGDIATCLRDLVRAPVDFDWESVS